MLHPLDFTGILHCFVKQNAEPTQEIPPLSLPVVISEFSFCNQSERTVYNLLAYMLSSYMHIHTDKMSEILHTGSKRPFLSLKIPQAPLLSHILPCLQCFLGLTSEMQPPLSPARLPELLRDVSLMLGGDGGQSVLAPVARWISRPAVQAVCQGSCYCQALGALADF